MIVLRTVATFVALLFAVGALAQESTPEASSEAIAEAVRVLEGGGNTVVIVPEDEMMPAMAEPEVPPLAQRFAVARSELERVVMGVPMLFGRLRDALYAAGNGSISWLLPATAISLAGLLVGTLAYRLARKILSRMVRALGQAPLETRAGKIGVVLTVLTGTLGGAGAFFLAGSLTVLIIQPELSPPHVTGLMAVYSGAVFLAARGVLLAALLPHSGEARVFGLSDALARSLYYQLLIAGIIANVVAFLCYWFAYFPLAPASHQFLLLVAPTASVVLFLIVMLVMHRREITDAIVGPSARPRPIRRFFGTAWPLILILYMAIAWGLTAEGVLLNERLALGPILSPFLALVVVLVVGGLLIIFHDRRLATGIANHAWTELYEQTAIGLAWIVGAAVLAGLWRLYGSVWDETVRTALGLAVVLLFAWAAWRAVQLFVHLRLADEADAGEDAADSEGEGFGTGASRLATLLPILRNVVFFFILSIVVMVILASLGVNVGPLFAGAGVVGLAIGFGAQALIRDIFSGAFFLLDDAFRRGEYVEVGTVRGSVERISVRSFQLRHHNGPLHTLPFGEIRQLTNYSRDWVIMKLPLRLTYDTDLERVRKLIKKMGQAMAEDPELGRYFIEPPKSQGVVQMEDSAMIVRVKFKTKPGDQFVVRRHVYQRLRELFEENDIHFAHREVTVRVAGTEDEEVRRKAALGATRAAEPDAGAQLGAADYAGVR